MSYTINDYKKLCLTFADAADADLDQGALEYCAKELLRMARHVLGIEIDGENTTLRQAYYLGWWACKSGPGVDPIESIGNNEAFDALFHYQDAHDYDSVSGEYFRGWDDAQCNLPYGTHADLED
jgi:hypothetical protein